MNEKLASYHKELLGDEFALFEEWMKKPLRKAVRVNPVRASVEEFRGELDKT